MKSLTIVLLLISSIDAISVGVGKSGITGPAAEIGMMGYAKTSQMTLGIHTRLYSRAFVFEENGARNVFVSADVGMIGQLVKLKVIEKVQQDLGPIYNASNVLLSATHTHSGPAGYLQYVLFQITSLGFVHQTFNDLVNGIANSILKAHKNVRPAKVFYSHSELHEASINRSPTSYLVNPIEERSMYKHDTDLDFHQLNIFNAENHEAMGVINWFAVHPTSMNKSNHLISGDNKGIASQLLEKDFNESFVAAFASANLGDVSPNIKGPKCVDTGHDCDLYKSTCGGRPQHCVASGPGQDMKDSTYVIGHRQYQKAKSLLEQAREQGLEINGPVKSIHQWIDMSKRKVNLEDGTIGLTCPAALGYSFAAGTTDGPGDFAFSQGTNSSNPFWNFVSGLIKTPTPEQEACHAPKPILLDTGEMNFPYAWHPNVIDTQLLQIGNIIITALPGEFTTMAGRRLKRAIEGRIRNVHKGTYNVILAGLSNVYTHYITTFEEYQRQRYEAASTIYGPHTLNAYMEQYEFLTEKLLMDQPVDPGTPPTNLEDVQLSFAPKVMFDHPPVGYWFGDVLLQPPSIVYKGEVVKVRFVTGHPLNFNQVFVDDDLTYLTVEKFNSSSSTWFVIATDNDWQTEFQWIRTQVLLGESEAEIRWFVPQEQEDGLYRISHYGAYKTMLKGKINYFSGTTNTFEVTSPWIRRRSGQAPKKIKPSLFSHFGKLLRKTFALFPTD